MHPERPLTAYAIRFAEASYDDGSVAAFAAAALGIPSASVTVGASDVGREIEKLVSVSGEPLADPAWVPASILSQRAVLDTRVASETAISDRVSERNILDVVQQNDCETTLAEGLLTKADRAGMGCALELRAPFLDVGVMEFAATLAPRSPSWTSTAHAERTGRAPSGRSSCSRSGSIGWRRSADR